jgi:hypothetical protein
MYGVWSIPTPLKSLSWAGKLEHPPWQAFRDSTIACSFWDSRAAATVMWHETQVLFMFIANHHFDNYIIYIDTCVWIKMYIYIHRYREREGDRLYTTFVSQVPKIACNLVFKAPQHRCRNNLFHWLDPFWG